MRDWIEIENNLLKDDIMREDIQEIEEKGRCSFDDYNTKSICSIFIDNEINFKCIKIDEDLFEITILEKED